ncbi:MAG: hypothetical protein M9904_02290 [Chitinophagaceae bacterium]|nr:hypothetical protein [Chitinophagaceae bacterium]
MKTSKLTKGEMINEIIGVARTSALANGRAFDGADMFFTLAFTTEKSLIKICKGLNIKTTKGIQ